MTRDAIRLLAALSRLTQRFSGGGSRTVAGVDLDFFGSFGDRQARLSSDAAGS